MKRQEFNQKIIKMIEEIINHNDSIRFIQLLWALNIINRDKDGNVEDRFYEESETTFKIIEIEYLKIMGKNNG